jgi:c-di-GMP-binding flagellar brake protein YcgR
MKDDLAKLLEGSNPEELSACIQMLALSVAQHRANCGFVALRKSMEKLDRPQDNGEELGLFVQSTEVIEEAIVLTRMLAADQAAAAELEETESSQKSAENRWQLRITVSAPIKVLWPGDSEPVNARLENISWGGAAFHVGKLKTDTGDTVEVILPSTRGGSISIQAKILRTWDLPNGQGFGVASRFSSLSTNDEPELENILELLSASADIEGNRQHARLAQRLDIQFDGTHELQATMDDISAGGMGITVPDPMQVGQSIQACISSLDENYTLKLRARVVRQETVKMGSVEVYNVGLKFEHPSEELNERTQEFIREMAAAQRVEPQ